MSVDLYLEFEKIVQQFPKKNALVDGNTYFNYTVIRNQAIALCDLLLEQGVRTHEHVGIMFPNGWSFIVAALAVWKAGAIVLPLHIKYREQELAKYLSDCQVRILLADHPATSMLKDLQDKCASLELVITNQTTENQWKFHGVSEQKKIDHPILKMAASSPSSIETPALTQYSTGSTGLSKRVTRTHLQLFSEFKTVSSVLGISEKDHILGAVPFFHSFGFSNAMLAGILSGATIFSQSEFFTRDAVKLIEQKKITGFPGVPFMFQLLVEFNSSPDFSSLRYVLSAGAPLADKTSRLFLEKFGMPICQLYGSTETGVICINRGKGVEGSSSSVGFPIPGVSVEVIDEQKQVVQSGMEGQIAIKSQYAALNYDSYTEKTESHFESGIFYPGDLGWIREDGRIVLTGRKRMFINVAGNKVDPVEVEAILRTHPAVIDAAVVGIPDGSGGEKIKAVLATSSVCTKMGITQFCHGKLADFKLPRIVEFRSEIPKSPLGKVLRKYLLQSPDQIQAQYQFFVDSGFQNVSASEKSSGLTVDFTLVPPLLRVISVVDGPVTKALEAYFWEPVDSECLKQETTKCLNSVSEINISAGESVINRRVKLRGTLSRTIYGLAETMIRDDALAADLKKKLIDGQINLDDLLSDKKLEVSREFLEVSRGVAEHWAQDLGIDSKDPVLIRQYRIFQKQKPIILIKEVFPESRFDMSNKVVERSLKAA